MSDHFQIISIVVGAIQSCRSETTGNHGDADISTEESNCSTEQLNCLAKAILRALAESGLQIVAMPKGNGIVDEKLAG